MDLPDEIIEQLGGLTKTIAAVGNGIPAGFTASKILWLKKNEPENYRKLRWVLLPHDYINFFLTKLFAVVGAEWQNINWLGDPRGLIQLIVTPLGVKIPSTQWYLRGPSIAWMAITIVIDLPLFLSPFIGMSASEYAADIGLTYLMIPIIASVSRDLFMAVPQDLQDGAAALGSTRWEVIRGVVLPSTASGMIAASACEDALRGLGALCIEVDPERNRTPADGARRIGAATSRVEVLVVPTDEELAIARQVREMLGDSLG